MPQNTKTLNIPHGGNLSMNKNQDELMIHVTQTCQWCYSDPNSIFSSMLPPGQYAPGDYGPYAATGTGSMTYDDNNPCNPSGGVTATPHTITVTGGN